MQVLVNGKTTAGLDRNKAVNVSLPGLASEDSHGSHVTLDILVEGIGRDNSGSKFDLKGLISEHILLDGELFPFVLMLLTPECMLVDGQHFLWL